VFDEDPRHGFNDDAETRRLLRSPPTPAALGWVEAATGHHVIDWSVLRGGMSSAMYSLEFGDRAGAGLVLRCYVRPELNEEEPDLAAREAAALVVAATAASPTPELVAVDPMGDDVGVPALLMTLLPGQVVWDPKGPMRWLARLAAVLPDIHGTTVTEPGVGEYFNYEPNSYAPPEWAGEPKVWGRAVDIFNGPIREECRSFIHRDFHPGNVLWRRGRVSGVVDWQSACVGPPSIDIAHCRANLLRYAPDLAEIYTRLAEESTERSFHPWADIACLIGMLDGLRSSPPRPSGRRGVETAIAKAVAACK